MHNLPEWKISHEGKSTIIHFTCAGVKVCDVLDDGANNKAFKLYTDAIDFDIMEVIIQIANNKIPISTP